jgi:uncharacterized protein (TIGR02217 family)
MTGFVDEYLPARIRAFPWTSSPRWSTTITAVSSAAEHRNQNWLNPLHAYKASQAVRCHEELEDLLDHWMVMRGPLHTFPLQDPLDFASARLQKANLAPTIVSTDQILGIGDDVTRTFQLIKKYTRGGQSYTRPITLPVVDSVLVALNAIDPDDSGSPGGPYSVEISRETGEITFDHAPPPGAIVTAGFLFDVPVRFLADDSFDRIISAYQVDGFADLDFVEVRPCSDGVSS